VSSSLEFLNLPVEDLPVLLVCGEDTESHPTPSHLISYKAVGKMDVTKVQKMLDSGKHGVNGTDWKNR
jgi:hypothetical protein